MISAEARLYGAICHRPVTVQALLAQKATTRFCPDPHDDNVAKTGDVTRFHMVVVIIKTTEIR